MLRPIADNLRPPTMRLTRLSCVMPLTPFGPLGHFPLKGGKRRFSACLTSAAANAFAPSQGEMALRSNGRGGRRLVIT
jgi:hypothetical protein